MRNVRAKGRIEKLERVFGLSEKQNTLVCDIVYSTEESNEAKWKSEGYVKEGDSWVRYVEYAGKASRIRDFGQRCLQVRIVMNEVVQQRPQESVNEN